MIGARPSRSRWACWRRRNCSASTSTCPPRCRRRSSKALLRAAPPAGLSADEKRAFERLAFFFTHGLSYAQQMANHPQTLYGIADSPVGLAAWFLDHDIAELRTHRARLRRTAAKASRATTCSTTSRSLADQHGDLLGSSLPGEQAALLRADGRQDPGRRQRLPDELYQPRAAGRSGRIPSSSTTTSSPKGGHFAAWEQPQSFTEELRAGFRSLAEMSTEAIPSKPAGRTRGLSTKGIP